MKKILTHLTGIGFLIAILIAGACSSGVKQNSTEEEKKGVSTLTPPPNNKHIYLKDSLLNDGTMHLFMGDKKSECGVIDDHLIVAKRGHTVKWKNADGSKINEIMYIRPVGDTAFFGAVPEIETTGVSSSEVFEVNNGVHRLVIPESAPLDTLVKYEIAFTVEDDDTIYVIDPYLKIPPP